MYQEGAFLIIDKPQAWTSHDVVAKCRGILGIRKIGHLGTLDPLATGVLVLAVGRGATKQVSKYMGLEKEYEVEMELWKSSDTYDREGLIVEHSHSSGINEDRIKNEMQKFWGLSMQTPPPFSAKKVNGRRAYTLARSGKLPKLKAREVRMYGENIEVDLPFVRFKVRVSSGTYIRSLVHDIGVNLGTGALMTDLRRTCVGDFCLEDAISIEELSKNPSEAPFILVK